VRFLAKPQRFINPYLLYRFDSDVCLLEQNRQLFLDLSSINLFKRVDRIEHDKTKSDDVIRMVLEDNPAYVSTPWQYVTERYRSYGDRDSLEWVELIEGFCKDLTASHEKLLKRAQNCLITQQKPKENENILSSKPGFWTNSKYTKHGLVLQSICFNWRYLLMLGHDADEFISKLLREGIPRIHAMDDDYSKKIGKMSFISTVDNMFGDNKHDRETYVYDKNENQIPVIQQYQAFYSLDEDGNVDAKNFFSFGIDPLKSMIVTSQNQPESPSFQSHSSKMGL